MATLAKVVGLVTFFDLLTLVNLVKVVNLDGVRGGMVEMEKINQMEELEARHFPHSSVTRHTSAHTRLPQKGVFGEFIIMVVVITIIGAVIIVKMTFITDRAVLVFKSQNHL